MSGFEDNGYRKKSASWSKPVRQRFQEEVNAISMKLGVIDKGKDWVIHDGNEIPFMKPEGYRSISKRSKRFA